MYAAIEASKFPSNLHCTLYVSSDSPVYNADYRIRVALCRYESYEVLREMDF